MNKPDLPHDEAAERTLLAICINNTEGDYAAFDTAVAHGISLESFYVWKHRLLWAVILKQRSEAKLISDDHLYSAMRDITVGSLHGFERDHQKEKKACACMDFSQVIDIANEFSAYPIEGFVSTLKDKELLRATISCGERLVQAGMLGTMNGDEAKGVAEAELLNLTGKTTARDTSTLAYDAIQKRIQELIEGTNDKPRYKLGFPFMDGQIGGVPKGHNIVIGARPSTGKCLGAGTPVMMFDGTIKEVQDIVVGDKLMGDDSTPRTVLSTVKGRDRMYLVKQKRAMNYRVNKDHILSLKQSGNLWGRSHGTIENIPIEDFLKRSAKFQHRMKGYKVPIEFEPQPIPIDPYILGLWLGDGTSSNCNITAADKEIIDEIYGYAGRTNHKVVVRRQENNQSDVYCIVKDRKGFAPNKDCLQRRLRDFGLLGNKHIPHEYIQNDRSVRLQILAGILDADGYLIGKEHGTGYEIAQKNKRLANDIYHLCNTLGLRTSIRPKTAKCGDYTCTVWKVLIYGYLNDIPCRVERKIAHSSPKSRYPVAAVEIKEDGVDDYYGFEIDGNRLFVLGDGTVTHNTSLCLQICSNLCSAGLRGVFFSMESPKQQIIDRLIAYHAQEPIKRIEEGIANRAALKRKATTFPKGLLIDDGRGRTVFDIRSLARRYKQTHGVDFVACDHFGRIKLAGSGARRDERFAMDEISTELDDMKHELDAIIITLAQFNRSSEREKRKPMMSDLRQVGRLEEDADTILLLSRIFGDDGESLENKRHIYCPKNRDGQAAWGAELNFNGPTYRFTDPSERMFEVPIEEIAF